MKNLARAVALLSILLAAPAWAGDGVWTSAGPPGIRNEGVLNQLVLDPFSPSTLYLVYFGHDSSGAWKTYPIPSGARYETATRPVREVTTRRS